MTLDRENNFPASAYTIEQWNAVPHLIELLLFCSFHFWSIIFYIFWQETTDILYIAETNTNTGIVFDNWVTNAHIDPINLLENDENDENDVLLLAFINQIVIIGGIRSHCVSFEGGNLA